MYLFSQTTIPSKRSLFFSTVAVVLMTASCMNGEHAQMQNLAKQVFDRAAAQAKIMDARLPEGEFPRSVFPDGTPENAPVNYWCSGFFPGSLWYIYKYDQDPSILELARKHTARLDSLYWRPTHHDIGFQINCSYGNGLDAYPEYDSYMLQCAEKLAGRFSPVTGTIRSWDNPKFGDYPVIIDNMMNLELLMVMARRHGRDDLKQIAYTHANTTMKNHFREDFSSWHLVQYSPENGSTVGKRTVQGYSDDSAWARGQAWGLYGYTMMAREASLAGDKEESGKYLDRAEHIAHYLLGRIPEDGVPLWDYDLPDSLTQYKDASAAAIMASAFAELSGETSDKALSHDCLEMAFRQVKTLASDAYLAPEGTNAGFLLIHSIGDMGHMKDIDTPETYADYYFLEAVSRLLKKI